MVKCHLALSLLVIVLAGHLNWTDGRAERQKRTIGGSSISRGQFPFLVLLKATIVTRRILGLLPVRHYHLYCGGVLIHDRWLLSAAHCFTDGRAARRASNWEARMGTVQLRAGVRERLLDLVGRVTRMHDLRQWEVDVDRIVIHPGFQSTGLLTNDIALIKLSSSIPRRRVSFISTVDLPPVSNSSFPNVGDQCITMGWGCTAPGRGPSRQARRISMPITSSSVCRYHYGPMAMDARICAGHTNRGIGVCRGDSGSPLVCPTADGYKLAGIVSLTSRERPESFPAVFASVKDYLPWIQRVIEQN